MTDNQPLDIGQIMRRVRQGARSGAGEDANTAASPAHASFFHGAFLDVERNAFDLEELLALHDRTFVTLAYQAMLKRDPDPEGFDYYLQMLRSGRLRKERILASFRDSDEGKKQNVRVRGLGWAVFKLKITRVPLLGGVADYLFALFGLRRIRADLVKKEAALGRLYEEAGLALARLESRVESRLDAKADKKRLEDKVDIREMDRYLRTVSHVLDMVMTVNDSPARAPEETPPPGAEAHSERWIDELYLTFEDAFRGSRELIAKRLAVYVPEVRAAVEQAASIGPTQPPHPECRVVDLGCGRGEFLGLLSEAGIANMGIDSNRVMVQQGRDRGLAVREQDIFAFLAEMPAECMAAVTAFQVLEHLPFPRQLLLIDQCRRILSPGGVLILETPNPENILAGAVDFHRDPTHLKPVHPDTLLLLARARGFSRPRISYPWQAEDGQIILKDAEGGQFTEFADYLAAARDYALLAYKG